MFDQPSSITHDTLQGEPRLPLPRHAPSSGEKTVLVSTRDILPGSFARLLLPGNLVLVEKFTNVESKGISWWSRHLVMACYIRLKSMNAASLLAILGLCIDCILRFASEDYRIHCPPTLNRIMISVDLALIMVIIWFSAFPLNITRMLYHFEGLIGPDPGSKLLRGGLRKLVYFAVYRIFCAIFISSTTKHHHGARSINKSQSSHSDEIRQRQQEYLKHYQEYRKHIRAPSTDALPTWLNNFYHVFVTYYRLHLARMAYQEVQQVQDLHSWARCYNQFATLRYALVPAYGPNLIVWVPRDSKTTSSSSGA
ncbi:hypothetical protein QBC40DRAFT_291764 [Triangularia verruculosa]|uniref:Uncharacterized protein n=1 Tax=Triangularia verruculosa TaxID=2587418 RepID=A0AAN7AZW2_9PEZI|nr:hypothetical protein QBC40DRAFT_291764 [Triangularia verruculosa]